MGYVGFSVAFAFSCAGGAARGQAGRDVGALVQAVDATIAWSFLTLGIALGSWWAYYELGWGGWRFCFRLPSRSETANPCELLTATTSESGYADQVKTEESDRARLGNRTHLLDRADGEVVEAEEVDARLRVAELDAGDLLQRSWVRCPRRARRRPGRQACRR